MISFVGLVIGLMMMRLKRFQVTHRFSETFQIIIFVNINYLGFLLIGHARGRGHSLCN